MKKILISIIILLLLIATCFAVFKGIKFAKIKSVKDIKTETQKLDANIQSAEKLANETYPKKVQTLEDAIKNLKLAKQQYENKKPTDPNSTTITTLEVKTYKIHYLWTILGNYRKDDGVRSLNLDLKSTTNKDVYDLQFTLVGTYVSITDFLYSIEDDEELKFEIKNFKIARTDDKVAVTSGDTSSVSTNSLLKTNVTLNTTKTNTTKTNTNTNTSSSSSKADVSEGGTILKATFTVENIGITLD